MGHTRLGNLPRTRSWLEVVGLIAAGAEASQIATATLVAAEKDFNRAANDQGVVEAMWLLAQLPIAARSSDFTEALRDLGINVANSPSLLEIVGAVSDNIDRSMPNGRGRSDLGDIAQFAAVETITSVVGSQSKSLLGDSADAVQDQFARLATVKKFGSFARQFFARFVGRCLNSYISRALSNHVGDGKRFGTLAQVAEFKRGIESHAHEASRIVEQFAGDWFSKKQWSSEGVLTRQDIAGFTSHAMTKLTSELRRG